MHSDEAWDQREVIEDFPCLSLAIATNKISIFAAIWTVHTLLVHSCKTTAGVDTTIVSDRFETRKCL
jgi:hypothetical protein